MNLKFFNLAESLTSTYPYRWQNVGKNVSLAKFKDLSGNEVIVEFESDEKSRFVVVDFSRKNGDKFSVDTTGQGDQFKIFATVIKSMIDYYNIKGNSLREFFFTSIKDGTSIATDNRTRLYKKFIARFFKSPQWIIDIDENRYRSTYTITNTDFNEDSDFN